ncbi:NAD(P)-binding protein [Schizophyllum commune Tattone D]|nr:NAD(P)-binding protein [Schizophyllum commune Tattone D]
MTEDGRKSVLITGCTAGSIGDALAREFHARDFRVFATSRNYETMSTLAQEGIETIKLDITQDEDIERVAREVSMRTGGTLDVLVNNAGVGYSFSVVDSNMAKVRQLFNINVVGHYAMTHAFIPLLLKSDRGVVLFTSSIGGVVPMPLNAAYSASKAAISALSDTLRLELAPFGVKVINLVTGMVYSNLAPRVNIDEVFPEGSLYKPIQPDFVAMFARSMETSTPTAVYAKGVVDEVLKKSPAAWYWSGGLSTMTWLLSVFAPRGITDWIFTKQCGLDKLAEIERTQKKA